MVGQGLEGSKSPRIVTSTGRLKGGHVRALGAKNTGKLSLDCVVKSSKCKFNRIDTGFE